MATTLHLRADARRIPLADESVHCICTSPPYFGLRDYGSDGQIGLEQLHDCLGWARGKACAECYVCTMRGVARELWRVLRDDGVLWLNLGDSYTSAGGGRAGYSGGNLEGGESTQVEAGRLRVSTRGLPPKNLIGTPWRVAFALQADGWTLRSDVIWHKPNPMPESVQDRCTKAHEYVFQFTKGPRYWWDAEALREGDGGKPAGNTKCISAMRSKQPGVPVGGVLDRESWRPGGGRNRRTVWTIATQPYKGAHFAVWPPALVEPMILAACPPGGVVLDPFGGSGTTAKVANENGRSAILLDLSAEYIELQRRRCSGVQVDMLRAMGLG
jgi:DNA modification methylase